MKPKTKSDIISILKSNGFREIFAESIRMRDYEELVEVYIEKTKVWKVFAR